MKTGSNGSSLPDIVMPRGPANLGSSTVYVIRWVGSGSSKHHHYRHLSISISTIIVNIMLLFTKKVHKKTSADSQSTGRPGQNITNAKHVLTTDEFAKTVENATNKIL